MERQLKVPIHPYIKNVLKFSGYDNCYAISTIEESDLEHIQTEIRKGDDILKFFEENSSALSPESILPIISLKTVLEGSNKKTFEEFEFSLGHQKLIMCIAKLVRENLDKNGVNGFAENVASTSMPRMPHSSRLGATRKRQKNIFKINAPEDVMKFHEMILVKKAMVSLNNFHTKCTKCCPKLYEKVSALTLRIIKFL